jgi:drug/metabolite transporter (DMT)-like permease
MISIGVKRMLIATVFFSLMNFCVKLLGHIPAYEVVFFRCLISLVLSLSYLLYYKIPLWGNQKKYLILRGVFGVTALTMYFTTLQHIPLASAVIIQYLSPIFTSLIAVYMVGEKLSWKQLAFFGISFAGVAVIKGFDSNIPNIYFAMGLGAAIFSALAYNMVAKVRKTDHPLVVVFYFPLIGTPITGAISYMNWVPPHGWDWLILLTVGVTTQIAQVNMTKALQTENVARVSSIRYMGIIYAILFGVFYFHESYSIMAMAGMIMVVIGVILNIRYRHQKTA